MVHLLSISGLHIAILAAGLFWFLRLGLVAAERCLRGRRRGLTIVYALLINAEPPAVRATIIVLVACASASWPAGAGLQFARGGSIVVLAMNPADLFRVGSQLSFLAAAVLGYCGVMRSHRAPPDPLQVLIDRSRPWPLHWSRKLAGQIGDRAAAHRCGVAGDAPLDCNAVSCRFARGAAADADLGDSDQCWLAGRLWCAGIGLACAAAGRGDRLDL